MMILIYIMQSKVNTSKAPGLNVAHRGEVHKFHPFNAIVKEENNTLASWSILGQILEEKAVEVASFRRLKGERDLTKPHLMLR